MSVIVTDPDGRIFIFTKGADSVLIKKVTKNRDLIPSCEENAIRFAKKGLRTLMMVYNEISEEELKEWEIKYNVYIIFYLGS